MFILIFRDFAAIRTQVTASGSKFPKAEVSPWYLQRKLSRIFTDELRRTLSDFDEFKQSLHHSDMAVTNLSLVPPVNNL